MDTEKQFVVMSKKDVEEMIQQAAVAGAQVASDKMLVAQRRAEDIMEMKDDKVIVESIRTSAKRTALMVQHIDKMLDVYRIYCSKISDRDKRRYKIIKDLYISKKPMKIDEISKKYSVSKVTVYEDIKIAKERLSSLFFGIDGLRIF